MKHLFQSQVEWDHYVISKWQAKRNDAKQRKIEFAMTFRMMDNILRAKKCAYSGVRLTLCREGEESKPSDVSIERVNPDKGYVQGNVIAVCRLANNIKSMTEQNGLTSMKETHMILTKALKRIAKQEN